MHPEATPNQSEINNEQCLIAATAESPAAILQDASLSSHEEPARMVPDETSGQGLHTFPDETRAGSSFPFMSRAASASASSVSSAPSVLSFAIPSADSSRFASLPDSVRVDIRRHLIAFAAIHRAEQTGCPAAPEIRRQALALTCSATRLRTKWFAYKRTGDWTTLVNKAKAGPDWWDTREQVGLPAEFVAFWKTLCEENQRADKAAWNELIHIYKTGLTSQGKRRQIPGYTNASVSSVSSSPSVSSDPFTGLPRGWTYANLTRYSPSKFEKSAARQGRTAAHAFRRKVFSTRVGLQVGQFILFDDQEYDLKVNFLGNQRKAMRPLGLNALDLASACSFAYGFKPTLLDEDGARKKLKEVDMMWFVVDVLTRFGFNPVTGTHFVVEHGTAAIRADFEERIAQVTQGRVLVDRSGIGGASSFAALFEGSAKGNPRFKAPLESFFNLVRNRFAALPGQVGKDRNSSPEELAGRDRYNDKLLRAMDSLPPDRAALLTLPFLSWHQFVDLALHIYDLINGRVDHDLEGWEKSGYVAHEWRLTPSCQWLPMAEFRALPAPQQMSLTELFNSPHGAALSRSRKLSPREVFNASASRLQRLPNHALPELLGLEFAHEKRIRPDGYLIIEDQELDPEPIRYHLTDLRNPQSRDRQGAPPDRVHVFINPFDPSRTAILVDAKNRYLGELRPQGAPSRADVESIHRQMGAARKAESALLAPLQARHAEAARAKTRMHRHNADVLAGKPITPAEADRAEQLRVNQREHGAEAAEDILSCVPDSIGTSDATPQSNETDETLINDIL